MDDLTPGGGSRLLDIAVTVLLASMALYGAVLILQAIWVWLCIGMTTVAAFAAIGWIVFRNNRRW